MAVYAYDIECLKNFFSAIFIDVENKKEILTFSIGAGRDDLDALVSFLKQKNTYVGYNNHSYDDPMLRYVMAYKGNNINLALHELSKKLVDDNFKQDKNLKDLRYPKNYSYAWKTIDLMRMMYFDKLGVSLKQVAISLRWEKIQDMPIHHDTIITSNQVSDILSYNKNDVLITIRLYEEVTPLRKLREELSKLYHVDLSSASDSRMANLILEEIYEKETNKEISQIRDLRTPRTRVLLGECIASFVKFSTPQLKELAKRISATYVYDHNNFKYSEKIYYGNCRFSLGIGGLHSEDDPGIFVTDNEYIIQDMDVASYYPNLIINNKFYPQHLGEEFIDILKKITEERIEAKKSGDKVKADGLKITVNSIFGKLGFKWFWLLDAKQMLSTTVSGQLGLLMLIEGLHENGIHVISANTDGVVCKIPRNLEARYYEIAHAWERATGLTLEYTPYERYIRRDVNSYITVKSDGSTKEKGVFIKDVDLKKSYKMPIVPKALYEYFVNGIPIMQTIESSTDIMDFCISQKTGANFEIEWHTKKGVIPQQKTNRFFISKNGGALIKKDRNTGKEIGLYVGNLVTILNNFDPKVPFKKYSVDFGFYEKEVMKVLDEIEPRQMSLFDLSTLGGGGKIQNSFSPSIQPQEEELSVSALMKLGKNQFATKLENIVSDYKKVEGISSKYVYTISVNGKAMEVEVYCLAKGVSDILKINKAQYKQNPISPGMLLYCDKFKKLSDGSFEIEKYTITETLEEECPSLF